MNGRVFRGLRAAERARANHGYSTSYIEIRQAPASLIHIIRKTGVSPLRVPKRTFMP